MADTQILPGGQGAAPQDWTLPASVELVVKAVRASFDGSSSAVSWYPAVELLSDAGDRIALAITGSSRAAGESADVSFFPGGGLGAGAAAAATPDLLYISGTGVFSIASSATTNQISLNPAVISWGTDAGAETASSYFDLGEEAGTYGIKILDYGLYLVFTYAYANPASAAANSVIQLALTGTQFEFGGRLTGGFVVQLDGVSITGEASLIGWLDHPASYGGAPFYHYFELGQNSGVSVSCVTGFTVIRVNDGNTGF